MALHNSSSSKNVRPKALAEINVTPMVDVMLVLLVIFMISAPLLYSGVELKLPKTTEKQPLKVNQDQIILSLNKAGEFFIGDQAYHEEDAYRELQTTFSKKTDQTLFIRADETLPYGVVAKVMSILKGRGINQLALVTETISTPKQNVEKKNEK